MPVRWLLADEVGLGKTIEAALIMNRLLHTQRIERCLVVAPEALTVQWLGELWRKYHQVFTLLDPPRLADVARDFGAGFNPFDVHRRAVIALETLVERPELTGAGGRRPASTCSSSTRRSGCGARRGHPGEPAYRAIAPIAALGRHVLLLSATPLEDDAHGFFRLLQLLRPEEFPEAAGRRGAARRRACRCRRAPARRAGSTSAACRRACRSRSTFRPKAASTRSAPAARSRHGWRPRTVPDPIPWPRGARSIASGGRWPPAPR